MVSSCWSLHKISKTQNIRKVKIPRPTFIEYLWNVFWLNIFIFRHTLHLHNRKFQDGKLYNCTIVGSLLFYDLLNHLFESLFHGWIIHCFKMTFLCLIVGFLCFRVRFFWLNVVVAESAVCEVQTLAGTWLAFIRKLFQSQIWPFSLHSMALRGKLRDFEMFSLKAI